MVIFLFQKKVKSDAYACFTLLLALRMRNVCEEACSSWRPRLEIAYPRRRGGTEKDKHLLIHFVDTVNSCIYKYLMTNFNYDLQESLGFMTITANRLMSSYLRRKMREAGLDLTSEQWGVLVQLWHGGGTSQDELAHVACVDKSSMSRVLAVMEDKGLIDRQVDPADSRRKIVNASDKAMELQERSQEAARQALGAALANVSPEDHAVCLNVLAAIKQNLRDIAE